ncbi:MAG: DUF3095 family protein [Rhodoferax sp.]|nr:DUF3095 family protein [Rhodoferax sp.]
MTEPAGTDADERSLRFFADLPVLATADATFDTSRYRPAPDDWVLVVTDIVGSTQAVAAGQHKTVNFVAAMAIAALKNLCAPTSLPFLFGGDGSVVMVPPRFAEAARLALARVRGFALRECGLQLRVGAVPVGLLRGFGCDVLVGRFEPSPGNSFGVFLGGGIATLESAVRGRGDAALAAQAAIPAELDDGQPVDLDGLSCRWKPLQSGRGKMVTLILQGARDPGAVHAQVMALAGQGPASRPARRDTLRGSWPPGNLWLEARAARRGGSLWGAWLRLMVWTFLAWLILKVGRPIGRFDPDRYLDEVAHNTDFCKHDDTVSFVIDCPLPAIDAIRAYLDGLAAQGTLRYGMHVSETALMTCLVTSTVDSLHVHFVDGGDGGYTSAAKVLKAQARGPAASSAAP